MHVKLSYVLSVMAVTAVTAGLTAGQTAVASPRPGTGEAAGGSAVTGQSRARSVPQFVPRTLQAKAPGNFGGSAIKRPTIPFYQDSFSYKGKKYPYTSMGTDPRTSTATTHIPVVFIPIRIYVPGASNWPTGSIKLTTESPLFRDSAATNNTQYVRVGIVD